MIVILFHKKTGQLARTALAHKIRHLSVICEISLTLKAMRRLSCDHCKLAQGAPAIIVRPIDTHAASNLFTTHLRKEAR